VDDREVLYLALPFLVLLFVIGGFLLVYGRGRLEDRPWWGNPLLWLTMCVVLVVLGVFVWPGLFGGMFLFLPFVWVWRPRRQPPVDPRTNGHARRDGPVR
jgi:hypothetical protein